MTISTIHAVSKAYFVDNGYHTKYTQSISSVFQWIGSPPVDGSVVVTESSLSFEVLRYSDDEGRHPQARLTGLDFVYTDGQVQSGQITGIELYEADGVTLLQSVEFTTPVDVNPFPNLYSSFRPFLSFDFFGAFVDDDIISGSAGDDALYGGQGFDIIFAGAGDDYIKLTSGIVDGGVGYDHLAVSFENSAQSLIVDLSGAETGQAIQIGENLHVRNIENFSIECGLGDDTIIGSSGDDYFRGGGGDDNLFGGDGNDWLVSSWHSDVMPFGEGNDLLFGGDGNDRMSLNYSNFFRNGSIADLGVDVIDGGSGRDELSIYYNGLALEFSYDFRKAETETGMSYINGSVIRNIESISIHLYIEPTEFENNIFGTTGNDRISIDSGNNVINGHDGNDYLNGGAGSDTLSGGSGDDRLYGSSGNDTLVGGDGDDWIVYDAEDTESNVQGGDGYDTLYINDSLVPFSFNLTAQGFELAVHSVSMWEPHTPGPYYHPRSSSLTTTYNANWEMLAQSGTEFSGNSWSMAWANGRLTNYSYVDYWTNDYDFRKFDIAYDDQGRIDKTSIEYDTGLIVETDYSGDLLNSYSSRDVANIDSSYSYIETTYDTSSNLQTLEMTYDNGDRLNASYVNGAMSRYFYEDGYINNNPFLSYEAEFTTNGGLSRVTVTNDSLDYYVVNYQNGIMSSFEFHDGGENDLSYQSYIITYNAAGVAVSSFGLLDDGTTWSHLL